jgi:hypothetical protein
MMFLLENGPGTRRMTRAFGKDGKVYGGLSVKAIADACEVPVISEKIAPVRR